MLSRTAAVALVLLAACCAGLAGAQAIAVTPTQIVVNTTTINATLTLTPVSPYTKLFLIKKRFANCTEPMAVTATNSRTHVLTVNLAQQVSFGVQALDPDTYTICFRNSADGIGYKNFVPLAQTIAIARFQECRGGKFGICKATPPTLSSREGNATVRLYYARTGVETFIVKSKIYGIDTYNCTNLPPVELGLRSPVTTVKAGSTVTYNVLGLQPGNYIVCYKNTTTFRPLDVKVVVSGDIDAARSTVSCCDGPFVVGQRTYCQINANDAFGNPAGGQRDACELKVCPLTDGAGNTITDFVEPYFVSTGLFEFYFTATGSGCGAAAGVSYKGRTLGGNRVNYFTLYPTTVDTKRATSNCSYSSATGLTSCNVTRRDTFGNPVSTCSVRSDGKLHCDPAITP